VGVGTIAMETVVRGSVVGGLGPEGTGVACGGACVNICAWWGGANVGTYEPGYITSLTKEHIVNEYIEDLHSRQQVTAMEQQLMSSHLTTWWGGNCSACLVINI
jgi:ribosomal protein S5